MYNIIPLVLIMISLGVIIVIVARKFSILANIDVDSIQSEREAKFKEQIIGNRLKRNYFRYYSKISRIFRPVGEASGNLFKNFYAKLLEYKDNYKEEQAVNISEDDALKKMLIEIDELIDQEKLEEAEKKYIKIISLDSKNIKAFRGLGKLYFERKDFNEAKQTLGHAIKLLEKDYNDLLTRQSSGDDEERQEKEEVSRNLSATYFDLALVTKAMESFEESLSVIDKALAIEANNPRFLDTKLEISIMNKDKSQAKETLEKMKEVNPENAKLEELEKEVMEMESEE